MVCHFNPSRAQQATISGTEGIQFCILIVERPNELAKKILANWGKKIVSFRPPLTFIQVKHVADNHLKDVEIYQGL